MLENKIPFKILLLIDNTLGHPKTLMEMYIEINMVLKFADSIHSAAHGQRVILTFKSYLKSIFCKAIAVIVIPLMNQGNVS